MGQITKEYILSIINEQLQEYEMDEMAGTPSANWGTEISPQPIYIEIGNGILSRNPEYDIKDTEEQEANKFIPNFAAGNKVRIAPSGRKVLEFYNFYGNEEYKGNLDPLKKFVDLEYENMDDTVDDGTGRQVRNPLKKVFNSLPRNAQYSTSNVGIGRVSQTDEEYNKRTLLHKIISSFFTQPDLAEHMDMCGMPIIIGKKDFGEPTTTTRKESSANLINLHLEYQTLRDYEDIAHAFKESFGKYKAKARAEKRGIQLPTDPEYVKSLVQKLRSQSRHFAKVYRNGKWYINQRNDAPEHFELTPIYKLFMKSTQENKNYTVQSFLVIDGHLVGNQYQLTIIFKAINSNRDVNKDRGEQGEEIARATSMVSEIIPDDVDVRNFTLRNEIGQVNETNLNFFKLVFKKGFEGVKSQLMEIDPIQTLPTIDPASITQGFA